MSLPSTKDRSARFTKTSDEPLQQSEDRFRSLVTEIQDYAIFMLDPEGYISSWNVGAERIKGYQSEEAIGQHVSILYPPKDIKLHKPQHELDIALKKGRFEGEGWRTRKDGSQFWANTIITTMRDKAGELIGFSAVTRNLTKRKQVEEMLTLKIQELARSNAELEQFAYVASHDLREPLRTVSCFTQLLTKRYQGKGDKNTDEFVRFIVDGIARMEKLIDDLLTYSRIGKNTVEVPVNCEKVLSEVLDNFQAVLEKHHAVVTHDPLPVLETDILEWKQLLQNLLSNAIKFHGEKSPRVHISAEKKPSSTEKGKMEWLFSIKDNGIGIESQYFERIFVIFQKLHNQTDYPGTGMGLAICRKIVERHGGRIWVESQFGEGSTFYFTIPCSNSA